MNESEDPISALASGAIGLHVLFLSYVEAGFTPDQALHLVTAMILEAMRHPE